MEISKKSIIEKAKGLGKKLESLINGRKGYKINDLKLIVPKNAEQLGELVNRHLQVLRSSEENFIVPTENPRFSNGEGKAKICDSVRGKDVYILSDVGNYSISYQMRGADHFMGPDEHYADVKRIIAATSSHARSVSLVMPLLYESRQHKRKGRESLDCAIALQELYEYQIKNFVTFDVHDPGVANAVPKEDFENFFATSKILETMYEKDIEDVNNLLVLAPDMGAMERARYYADVIGCDIGCFNKRRDYSKLVNGKNPIVAHDYLGRDMNGKDIVIVDDIIASGGSVLDVAKRAKKMGANKVFICATFALFTEGTDAFERAYQEGLINRIYSTNLTYVPESIKAAPWYVDVDSSEKIAEIIHNLNIGKSLEPIHYDGNDTYIKLRQIKKQ